MKNEKLQSLILRPIQDKERKIWDQLMAKKDNSLP